MKRFLLTLALLITLLAPTIAQASGAEVRALVEAGLRDEGLNAAEVAFMSCISFHESSYDQWARSDTNDRGPMQFHMNDNGVTDMIGAGYGDRPNDPYWSGRAAGKLYRRGEIWRWRATAWMC